MPEYYILEGKEAVPCADARTWAQRFERNNRVVAKDTVGDSDVSTVFLGLNHQWTPDGPPLIFETMVFGGPLDQEQDRYSTWEEAEAGHKAMILRVQAAVPK